MSPVPGIRYVEIYDVARITLARPPLNVMTIAMMAELNDALDRAAANPVLKALVIAADGRAFSAGVAVEDHLGASGEVLSAADALRLGLFDRVVPPAYLGAAVDAQVERYRAQSAVVLRLTKRAVRESADVPFAQALAGLEELYRFELMQTQDAAEGLRAFAEKRAPVWHDR